MSDDLTIKVLDYDTIGIHEELGKVKIPLYEAADGKTCGAAGLLKKDFSLN